MPALFFTPIKESQRKLQNNAAKKFLRLLFEFPLLYLDLRCKSNAIL